MTFDELVMELRRLKFADKLRIIQVLANDLEADTDAQVPNSIDHRELCGVFAWNIGDEPSEITVRRIRDDDWN